MKLVFISHFFSVYKDTLNAIEIEELVDKLSEKYDDIMFLYQIPHDKKTSADIDFCPELLSQCDELWVAGMWGFDADQLCVYGYAIATQMPIYKLYKIGSEIIKRRVVDYENI